MKVSIKDFEEFLYNKNLKKLTVERYLYYFLNLSILGKKFNQSIINKFFTNKTNKNNVSRAFLVNYKKFLLLYHEELGLTDQERLEISEVEMPELSGRKVQKLIRPLSVEQIWQLEKYFPAEKEKLQVLLSFYGGLRIAELLKIQIISFNWEEWKKDMTKYGECTVYGKGSKEGIAFFPPWLMKRVAIYIKSGKFKSLSSYIFLHDLDSLEGINFEGRKNSWQKKMTKAGLDTEITKLDAEQKVIKGTEVHAHRLRHSYGFYLKAVKKFDIRDIQELMRHSSITSTQRYTLVEKSQLKELLEKETPKP